MTYNVKVEDAQKEITILNEEGFEYDGGYRRINVEKGSCCGHSPRVFFTEETAPFPDDVFNAHEDAMAEILVARSLSNENGIDARLVVICVLGFIVIVAIVAGTWAFNKPQTHTVNNYYATNTTANMTYSPTTTAGGPVLVK